MLRSSAFTRRAGGAVARRRRLGSAAVGGAVVVGAAGQVRGQERLWAVPMSAGTDISALQVSQDGGVFVIGSTTGSLGGANAGGRDVWVARYTRRGEVEWVRQFGTAGNDYGM